MNGPAGVVSGWLLEAFLSCRAGRPALCGPAPSTHAARAARCSPQPDTLALWRQSVRHAVVPIWQTVVSTADVGVPIGAYPLPPTCCPFQPITPPPLFTGPGLTATFSLPNLSLSTPLLLFYPRSLASTTSMPIRVGPNTLAWQLLLLLIISRPRTP